MKKYFTIFFVIVGFYLVLTFINDHGNPEINEINKAINEKDLFTN
tara:strand:- start:1147 stop:1281 length:135 start_codon:yes stop_codon:yes gene_type:complete